MRRNTRELICQEALRLFSVHGYEGVSVKAIANAVRIKDSSLYNHFESKRAIFDELQTQYQFTVEKMMNELETACCSDHLIGAASFQQVSDVFFENYLMDGFCNCFIRLMLIEQCHNTEMQKLYTKWMFDMPLQLQSKIFQKECPPDFFGELDYAYLSLKYYAPIYLYAHQYLLNGDLTAEKKNLFRMAAGKHILHFIKEMELR